MLKPILKRSDFVRPMNAETRVSASTAMIGRIELSIGDWALFGPDNAICAALSSLRYAERTTSNGESLRIFRGELVQHLTDAGKIKFSRNPTADSLSSPSVMVSGACQNVPWSYQRTARQQHERARIRFRTQLNLTRFLQGQKLQKVSRLDRPKVDGNLSLVFEPDTNWYSEEIPLSPTTNIIIGDDRKYAFALKSSRPTQFLHYSKLVEDMLEDVMDEAFDDASIRTERIPYFNLHAIEFYWEFDLQNAMEYVLALRPLILSASNSFSEREYQSSAPALEVTHQCPSYIVKITKLIHLKLYAKTNRRIRIEISYKDSAISAITGHGRVTSSLEDTAAFLPALAENAAQRVNRFLQSIVIAPIPPSHHTALSLVHMITREARHPAVAESIISALVALGRISCFKNDPLREAVHRLRDAGILATQTPGSSKYVVTEAFREPLSSLRKLR